MKKIKNQEVITLWPSGALAPEEPQALEQESDLWGSKVIRNVTCPTLTAYIPDPAIQNGTSVIVCPGGAFHFLSWGYEGVEVAQWLTQRGVTAFVLKYRLVRTAPDEAEFQQQFLKIFSAQGIKPEGLQVLRQQEKIGASDGQQAVRLIREHSLEWGLASDRIGMIGFSAGGAVTLGTALGEEAGSRLNFAAPIYAGVWEEITVPTEAPPLFLAVAADDGLAAGSLDIFKSWKAADLPVELHVYARGGHGFGMRKQGLPVDGWIERFGDWLAMLGYLSVRED